MSCGAQRTVLTQQLKESTFILSSLVVNVTEGVLLFQRHTVSVASLYLAGFLSLHNYIQITVNMAPHTVDKGEYDGVCGLFGDVLQIKPSTPQCYLYHCK